MKIALCLSGHFRSFDRIYLNLKKNLLDVYNPDVFIAAWTDSMGYWLPRSSTPDPLNHPGYQLRSPKPDNEYIQSVQNILKPKAFYFDSYQQYDQRFQQQMESLSNFYVHWDPQSAPKSVLSMNYMRHKVIDLKKQYEQENNFEYDWVIVTRFDINHSKSIDITQFDKNCITYVQGGAELDPGDTWGIATSSIMNVWGEQYANINELVEIKTMSLNPHLWHKAWLAHRNTAWKNVTHLGIDFIR